MTNTTALLLIDVQQSFQYRSYWQPAASEPFIARCNALIDGCVSAGVPIVRVFHQDGPEHADNPFSAVSGHVRPLKGLREFEASLTIVKHRHSALVATPLSIWLHRQGITRLVIAGIRTEQCCETTARHASDEGWEVDYVSEATLTFDMQSPGGRMLAAREIVERTETVLAGRFATICTVSEALARARRPEPVTA